MPTKLQGDQERLARVLRATHKDYDSELLWHRFLLDAYAGTGGFAGRIRLPFASFWGSAAEDYGTQLSTTLQGDLNDTEASIDTYLERFPREDVKKFARRVAVADFPNYCEPIVDLRHSYMNRKPMNYEGVEPLKDGETPWWSSVGEGMTWDSMMTQRARLRALVLGWFPMLIDAPKLSPGQSVAQARERGVRARLIPLFPSNLLEWDHDPDTGRMRWAKIRTTHVHRPSFDSPVTTVERFACWTEREVRTYEIHTDDQGNEQLLETGSVPHAFGEVPLVIYRAKPTPSDRVRGLSIIGSVARMNRKLFNYLSEFDEFLRSCVFAMLQAPTADPRAGGAVVGGNANVLYLDMKSSRDYKWISPDVSQSTIYETRVAKQIDEIHRVGRNESGGAKQIAKSGVAQAYDFEGMNRAISDNAAALAEAEQQTLRLVMRIESPATKPDAVRVIPPTKFDVEEMAKELEEALTAVDLKLGITATARMKQRLVRRLLPNLSEADAKLIDQEIEEQAEADAQAEAAAREMLSAAGEDDPEDDPGDDPGPQGGPNPEDVRLPPKGPPRAGERTQRPGKPRAKGPRSGA